jgi:anaphase-promoting complex subunit 5
MWVFDVCPSQSSYNGADDYQGESLATIVESFVRASHINITKGLANPTGAYILLQSAMYARIGMASWIDVTLEWS